jgi:CheY-like chemotaxis protein
VRILLADDSVTAQNMGKKILSEAGHEVVCVSNGAAALKKVTEQELDLVILDIYMPGYSGLEVCQRLKEGTATANLPVVLTVGKLEPFRKEDAQRVRAEALIIKPFEASELSAAVARFGEAVAVNSPKAKTRGKLGPQSKPKPQWDEPPADEFVVTTQKLEEEGYTPGSPKTAAAPAAEKMEPAAAPQPASAASEFEVAPAPESSNFSGATQITAGSNENFGGVAGARITETLGPASLPAEFNVQADPAMASSEQAEIPPKAAAAVAGADFAGSRERSEFPVGGPSPQDFEIAASFEAKIPGPSAFASQIATDAPASPVPEMSAATAPEFAAAADPYAGPGVDPAFNPDRTQWATDFPTRFGIAEPEEPADEKTAEPEQPVDDPANEKIEEPAKEEPEPEAACTPSDEIAAILSSFPGASINREPSSQPDEGVQFGQRPWPVEASGPEKEAWKAEEVPLEHPDNSVSLAEEMEKASAARDAEGSGQPGFAEAPALAEDVAPSGIVERREQESQPVPAATPEFTPPKEPEESAAAVAPSAVEESHGSPFVPEVTTASSAPDQIAGVMQSAAMAIATRATVSAVASQLHQQPAENPSAGSSAIEELVGQVLERLKPKLIAEIKRELKSDEK